MVWYGEAIDTSYTEAEEPRPAPPMTLIYIPGGIAAGLEKGHNYDRYLCGKNEKVSSRALFFEEIERYDNEEIKQR